MKNTNYLLKLSVILILSFLYFKPVQASHIVGGQISWECLQNGKYIFYMDHYINPEFSYPLSGTEHIQLLSDSSGEHLHSISLDADFERYDQMNPFESCSSNMYKIFTFTSDTILLSGTPPQAGWLLYWQDCCLPNATNLIAANSSNVVLRAKMYSLSGMAVDSCHDSSPNFMEEPVRTIYNGEDYHINYSPYDSDGDSISFHFDNILREIAQPYNPSVETKLNWDSNYSKDSPFPGPKQHTSNRAVLIDTANFHFSGKSNSARGLFAYSIRLDSYKKGVKTGSIWRNASFFFFDPTRLDSLRNNHQPQFSLNYVQDNKLTVSAEVGDSIHIPILLEDVDSLMKAWGLAAQKLTLTASSMHFKDNFGFNGKCQLDSSCAYLSPSPQYDQNTYRYELVDSGSIATDFIWNTDCQLLNVNGQEVDQRVFHFVFRAEDKFSGDCPMALQFATLSIELNRFQPKIEANGNYLYTDSADSYQWYYNGIPLSNSDTIAILAQNNGTYSVVLKKNGCTSKMANYEFQNVGIVEAEDRVAIKVYPNPFEQEFQIESDLLSQEHVQIYLTDIMGKKQSVHFERKSKKVISVRMMDKLPSGIYFINLSSGDNSRLVKVLKL